MPRHSFAMRLVILFYLYTSLALSHPLIASSLYLEDHPLCEIHLNQEKGVILTHSIVESLKTHALFPHIDHYLKDKPHLTSINDQLKELTQSGFSPSTVNIMKQKLTALEKALPSQMPDFKIFEKTLNEFIQCGIEASQSGTLKPGGAVQDLNSFTLPQALFLTNKYVNLEGHAILTTSALKQGTLFHLFSGAEKLAISSLRMTYITPSLKVFGLNENNISSAQALAFIDPKGQNLFLLTLTDLPHKRSWLQLYSFQGLKRWFGEIFFLYFGWAWNRG